MGDVGKAARISDCGQYRYWLTRLWAEDDSLLFVMLNPSTADASVDDPTIRRCMGFARREEFGGVSVVNLYAYRATNPKALLSVDDAVGPENDSYLRMILMEQTRRGHPVVAAWGANADADRAAEVLNLVPGVNWRCLGTTKSGAPRHPLYVHGEQPLMRYRRGI